MPQFFSFQGTASRQQYWWYTLAFLVSSVIFLLLLKIPSLGIWEFLIGVVWFAGWLCALISIGVRRCRDAGIHPHWPWLWLVPLAGSVFYIALGCLKPDDGTRIARPLPKQGLARYLSIFGYATRQEYWCIMLPVASAISIVSILVVYLIALLISLLLPSFSEEFLGEKDLLAHIFRFAISTTTLLVTSWLSTAVIVRRCRDAALDLKWSLVSVIPIWLFVIVIIPLDTMSEGELDLMAAKITAQLTQYLTPPSVIPPISILLSLLFFVFICVVFIVADIVFGCLTSKEGRGKEERRKT